MFAKGGAGKSELTLWALARAANGTDLHGNTINAVTTLYLDYEMTLEDIIDRVRSFGYDTDHIDAFRSHLHYGLLPSIDPLDTQRGGDALTEAAVTLDADIVVIDTLGRAVAGEEDSNDAIRAFYRHTGRLLKSKGIALLRIDHAGKDTTRGQRGASAKNDDVDVVLELTKPADDTITVKVEKRRMGWYPERLVAQRTNTGGRVDYTFEGVTDLDPVADIVAILDRLKIPTDWGRDRVRDALKRAGEDGGRNEHLAEALKRRRGG
jgi:archaellum biogenesis ATPase FlaH